MMLKSCDLKKMTEKEIILYILSMTGYNEIINVVHEKFSETGSEKIKKNKSTEIT